jgi:hypothetical protein
MAANYQNNNNEQENKKGILGLKRQRLSRLFFKVPEWKLRKLRQYLISA